MSGVLVGGAAFKVKAIAGISGDEDRDTRKTTVKYDVWREDGTFPDIADAVTAFSSTAPSTFDGLPFTGYSFAEDDDGNNHFIFTATYSSKAPEALLRWSFDSTGGTIKLMTSKNTTRYAPSGRVAPDFQGAIGVKNTGKDAEPEGIDVVIPGLKLTATYRWPAGVVDTAYVKTIAGLTGHTNNATFYDYAAGELLFLGASGEVNPTTSNEVQYHFLASQNATGLTIGTISSIAKKGHEYLWVAFEADQDSSAKKLVQRPLGVYVERVYDEGDFGLLDIGS